VTQEHLERTIGLPGAAFLIVGYVVGITIFMLPASLAATAGPAVYLGYLLAAVPALLACFVMAQIGSAIPASGSIYLLLRDALSPVSGFIYLWLMITLAAVVIPLLAFGFADYFAYFWPGLNPRMVAVVLIVLVIGINCLGMKEASGGQSVMVVGFIIALLIFGIGGMAFGNAELARPLLPHGFHPLIVAAVTAYFSYAGIYVIAEVAGEIKNPGRTIPLAIAVSFAVIILLYMLVPMALTRILPWQTLDTVPMAVVAAARTFLPSWVVAFIAAGALLAAITTINAMLMGLSRDFYKGAKSGLFPRYFAAIHPRFKTPARAVVTLGLLVLAGVFAGGEIVQYAQVAVMGLMVIQILTGLALLRLPGKLPQAYAASSFKLGRTPLRIVSIAYIVVSIAFLILLSIEQPDAIIPGCLFLLAGLGFYALGNRSAKPT